MEYIIKYINKFILYRCVVKQTTDLSEQSAAIQERFRDIILYLSRYSYWGYFKDTQEMKNRFEEYDDRSVRKLLQKKNYFKLQDKSILQEIARGEHQIIDFLKPEDLTIKEGKARFLLKNGWVLKTDLEPFIPFFDKKSSEYLQHQWFEHDKVIFHFSKHDFITLRFIRLKRDRQTMLNILNFVSASSSLHCDLFVRSAYFNDMCKGGDEGIALELTQLMSATSALRQRLFTGSWNNIDPRDVMALLTLQEDLNPRDLIPESIQDKTIAEFNQLQEQVKIKEDVFKTHNPKELNRKKSATARLREDGTIPPSYEEIGGLGLNVSDT